MSETMQKSGDIEDVLKILDRVQAEYKKQAPGQAASYDRLRLESHEPGAASDPQFRTRVAYAVQDVERLLGPTLQSDHYLHSEMSERAAHYPGLEQPVVVSMMQETRRLEQPVVNAIRSLASELVEGRQDPDHPDIAHTIDKLRATVFPEPSAKLATEHNQGAKVPPNSKTSPNSTSRSASPGGGIPPGEELSENGKSERRHTTDPYQNTGAKTDGVEKNAPENRSRAETHTPQEKEEPKRKDEKSQGTEREEIRVIRGGGFARLAEAIGSRIESQPTNPGPSWMEQAADFSARLHNARDEKSLEATEKLGKDAVEALREIKERPASSIMASISDAAGSDPNGMAGVLTEMKAGGKYADLYGQFVTEKENNQAFMAQLENVSSKLEAYGKGREAAEVTGQRMRMPGSVAQRFNQIDAEIGKSAAEVPGKKEGTSALEDMSEKVREMVQKAVTAVTDFMKRMSPGPSSSPSP